MENGNGRRSAMDEEARRRLIDYCLGLMEGMPRYSGMDEEEGSPSFSP